MVWRVVRLRVLAVTLCGLLVAFGGKVAWAAAEAKPFPPFPEVKQAIEQYFAAISDYQPGDIITRSQVQPLFAQLQRLGWTVSDRNEILGQVPGDSDFLVRQLRTRRGRTFMRQIGSNPDTYDRLERISRLPRGRLTVSELIQRPGKGSDVINYLADNPKGIQASKQMSRKVTGTKFDKPTGRIYTVKMLLDRLEASHEVDQENAAAPSGGAT